MTRILQISDTHIVAPGDLAYGAVDTAAALEALVQTVSAQADRLGPIDLVVVTGDLADHGTAEEYAHFRALTRALAPPLVAIPGNHDDREAMRAAFGEVPWMASAGPLNLRVDLAGVTVLGLDTLVVGAPHGRLAEATLDWLAAQLEEVGPTPVLLAMHHPPFATGIALMDRQGLENPGDLAACLARHAGPCRIVAGHVHRSVATAFAGHPAMICPGTSHAVTLDLRPDVNSSFMMETPGALLHDFGAAPVSHLVLSGAFGAPRPFGG